MTHLPQNAVVLVPNNKGFKAGSIPVVFCVLPGGHLLPVPANLRREAAGKSEVAFVRYCSRVTQFLECGGMNKREQSRPMAMNGGSDINAVRGCNPYTIRHFSNP